MAIEVKCICGKRLDCTISGSADDSGDVQWDVDVDPCPDCLQESYEKGVADTEE